MTASFSYRIDNERETVSSVNPVSVLKNTTFRKMRRPWNCSVQSYLCLHFPFLYVFPNLLPYNYTLNITSSYNNAKVISAVNKTAQDFQTVIKKLY